MYYLLPMWELLLSVARLYSTIHISSLNTVRRVRIISYSNRISVACCSDVTGVSVKFVCVLQFVFLYRFFAGYCVRFTRDFSLQTVDRFQFLCNLNKLTISSVHKILLRKMDYSNFICISNYVSIHWFETIKVGNRKSIKSIFCNNSDLHLCYAGVNGSSLSWKS